MLTSRFASSASVRAQKNPERVLRVTGVMTARASGRTGSPKRMGMDLPTVVRKLNEFAPPSLAEKWDNAGLLVEPTPPHSVGGLLLTNDLTPQVLDEAVEAKANLILSYHPPLFAPLKRLTQATWKERVIIRCLENRIAVYSPHTSYDVLKGGVNDWLMQAFDVQSVKPVEFKVNQDSQFTHTVSFNTPVNKAVEAKRMASHLQIANLPLNRILGQIASPSPDSLVENAFMFKSSDLSAVTDIVDKFSTGPPVFMQLAQPLLPGYGIGRIGELSKTLSLSVAVDCVKNHLKLSNIRLAAAYGKNDFGSLMVKTVAVCAGSGSSVLKDVSADLYVTGEMSHHDVLHATCNGTSVILCEHTNTERGFLSVLKEKLTTQLDNQVNIMVSAADKDPLSFE